MLYSLASFLVALIISYPVYESHTGPDKLCGQMLKAVCFFDCNSVAHFKGFTSHYVCVYKHGSCLEGPTEAGMSIFSDLFVNSHF